MSSTTQLRKIHFLRRQLALREEDYQAMLAAYGSGGGLPPATSRELSPDEASALIRALDWMVANCPDARRWGTPPSRRQQARVHDLWRCVSRMGNPAAGGRRSLDKFLQRRFGVRSARPLWTGKVPTVIRVLTAMKNHSARREAR